MAAIKEETAPIKCGPCLFDGNTVEPRYCLQKDHTLCEGLCDMSCDLDEESRRKKWNKISMIFEESVKQITLK
ncbi:hypothetical protein DPMN_062125 [Dreissena polymorpha]|uniref:Uncharacterized protein n=1 Tax=Dreissena polymorpha TaxID=45954 RepID=A0A9D4C993_DREPO|nr:hypothetical protein DPMN_062125 [Dreissena polymorpha]